MRATTGPMSRRARWASALAASALVAALAVPGAAGATAPRPAAPSAAATTFYFVQAASVAPGSRTAWAIGSADSATSTRSFLWKSSGGAWTAVGLPSTQPYSYLTTLTATSADGIWIGASEGDYQFFMVHGSAGWRDVRVDLPEKLASYTITSTAVLGATDVWAVGQDCSESGCATALIHYDGHTWAQVSPPDLGHGKVIAVAGSSPKQLWVSSATGCTLQGSCKSSFAYLYNGRTWHRWSLPVALTTFGPLAVDGPKNVWVAGAGVARYNGSRWVAERGAPAGTSVSSLAPFGSEDAWATGFQKEASGPSKPVVLRYVGPAGRSVALALPDKDADLTATVAASPTSAWLIGLGWTGKVCQSPSYTFSFHWNGTRWERVGIPPAGPADRATADVSPQC